MDVIPGPFAPVVTQYPYNFESDSVGAARLVQAIAEYPGDVAEQDTAAGDVITADLVLLLTPATTCSEYDEWVVTDGLRYRGDGAPKRYRHPQTGTAITRVNLRRIT